MSFLEKAEDYIMVIQSQQAPSDPRVPQLEQALEQEYQNQTSMKQRLQAQINRITIINNELTQQLHNYEIKIHEYTTTINKYETTINQFQTTINQYETTIHSLENRKVEAPAFTALFFGDIL